MLDDEQEDAESSDDGFDFDTIAEQAVKALDKTALAAVSSLEEEGELFLDIGVGRESLYLTAPDGADVDSTFYTKPFDTAVLTNRPTLDALDFMKGLEPKAPAPTAPTHEIRGEKVRPVDDSRLKKQERKKEREEKLDGWFGFTKRKMTPELEKELQAIQLRGYFDSKRFYKANDSDKLPTHFQIATVVGGGMAPAGEKPTAERRKGRSLLDTMLRDHSGQEFSDRKMREHMDRTRASRKSGHGNARPKGRESQKRRGDWKKTARRGSKNK
mmetsp:Transcript_22187/g.40828  ORF Transcript_22187/g.40828 Transcript_22187/m.40828 type:complete len:271 (-) Transcript_22187:23-835(-)